MINFIYLFIYFFAHLYGYVRCEPNSQLTYALQTNTYMHDPSSLARSNFLNTCFEKLIYFIFFFFCSPLFHILDCHLLRVPGPRLEARNLPQVCPRNLSTKWKHVTIRVFSIHLIEVKFLNLNSWFFFFIRKSTFHTFPQNQFSSKTTWDYTMVFHLNFVCQFYYTWNKRMGQKLESFSRYFT